MILFAVALAQELKIIKEEVKKIDLKWTKINFLLTWVWTLNTIYSIKDYISKNDKVDFIINLWVCWKINTDFNNFFQVYRIKNLSNNKEALSPVYIQNNELKSIACSDKIITNVNDLNSENFVDMESFWIDYICEKEKIPYIIIKKPLDIISDKSKNVNIKDLEYSLRWFNYHELINNINTFLNNNKNINNNEIILELKQKYKLTFSETELLKKYINKCVSFWEDINFIDKNDLLIKIKS